MSGPLQIETVPMRTLSEADRAAWLALRARDPRLESPYHHPDYHALVDAHQGDVRVTLARRDGQLVALLPWQGGRFARPSGAPMSDYQTVIGEALSVSDILRGQAVGAFHYSAMPGSEGEATARIEISEPDAWRKAQGGSYNRHMKSTRRRIRKAEEEVGPRRIVSQSRDIDAYSALMAWKRDKFAETGKYDVLANPGTSGLLRALWERPSDAELRADLHVLYFGDRIAAADLGLTDGHVFHSWIVGYDPELLPYAPGIQLLEGVIDASVETGYRVVDLGPGLDGYKRHYASHPRSVASGMVALPGAVGSVAKAYSAAEGAWRDSTGDALGKLRRRYSQIAACEPRLGARAQAMVGAVSGHFKSGQTS